MPLKPEAMEEQGLKFVDGPAASTKGRAVRVIAPRAASRPVQRQRVMVGLGCRAERIFLMRNRGVGTKENMFEDELWWWSCKGGLFRGSEAWHGRGSRLDRGLMVRAWAGVAFSVYHLF